MTQGLRAHGRDALYPRGAKGRQRARHHSDPEDDRDAEAVWELWADVPNRTRWDQSLEDISVEGPFERGATGFAKLKGQPERAFEVLDCEPLRAYTERFFLPMRGRMDWAHEIREVDDERDVTFDVSIHGPASLLLVLILKRILRRELPPTVDRLIALAEQR